ncbi:MAG: Phosphoesterase family protein [Acidobacteriaceae bacterium]|nr:Phosphoesterase family protein [Acidobacteriaceae bacterium]
MKKQILLLSLSVILASSMFAQQGSIPKGVPHLDHVFVIMMENHGYNQILNNPNAPFTNQYAKSANLATNYFAVAHPSLTNYLEAVGGSNFGVQSDNAPDWHNLTCMNNLTTGIPNTDNPTSSHVCPISGVGTDAATPAIDYTNETQGAPGEINVNGVVSYPAVSNTLGITIADQLVAAGKTWKSYQENLPASGADMINYSDGIFTNNTDFTKLNPQFNPPLTTGDVVQLYAAKHNPFVYFENVQQGTNPLNSFANIVGFDQDNGLWADLRAGKVPNYSFIAPNQCNDQHGRGNSTRFCLYDPNDDGTQAGLNPALILAGDQTIEKLVTAIHGSPVWKRGHNAIVVVWDENDYSLAPITNQVLTIVDTNYGFHNLAGGQFYTHFSLLKSIEGGLGLPCLNHACDATTNVMSDLFDEQ